MDKQTELMLKYGPKDVCYAANWENRDIHYIQKMCTKKDPNDIKHFFDQQEKRWNDHKHVYLELDNTRIEISEVAKAGDIVTVQGVQYCCRQIITTGLAPWRYHGVGDSIIEARAYQQRLFGEIEPRADMTGSGGAQGSITRSSQSINAIGIFPASFPTLTIRESGIFTNVTGYSTGVMFNRQQFSGTAIAHTVGGLSFTVATSITFGAVTTYG
jgi:hypothetical protein